MNGVRCL